MLILEFWHHVIKFGVDKLVSIIWKFAICFVGDDGKYKQDKVGQKRLPLLSPQWASGEANTSLNAKEKDSENQPPHVFLLTKKLGKSWLFIRHALNVTSVFISTKLWLLKQRMMEDTANSNFRCFMFYFYVFSVFQVRYTGYRDRPLHERQTKFICALREGHSEIVSPSLLRSRLWTCKFLFITGIYRYGFQCNADIWSHSCVQSCPQTMWLWKGTRKGEKSETY